MCCADEFNPLVYGAVTLTVKRNIPLPTVQIGAQKACTLTGSTLTVEGYGSLALTGGVLMLGTSVFLCWC
jgi:hypothetical protein